MNAPLVMHITTVDLGMRLLLFEQLRWLCAAGYAVEGVCSAGPLLGDIHAAGIPITPIALTRQVSPLRDGLALARLTHLFARRRPTIVHTHNPKPGLVAQLAARLARVPIVLHTVHGLYYEKHIGWRRRAFRQIERWSARLADVLLTVSREQAHTLIERNIAPAAKVQHLGDGIDLKRFNPCDHAPDQRQRIHAAFGIPPDALVIGAVGRLVADKGYHELFAAVSMLAQHHNVHLLVIGPPEPHKADGLSAADVSRYGIAERTHLLGLRHDVASLYAAMDVLALPSYREGLPRVLMEAAAMGLPCVASNIAGCRELVRDGVSGLLVPPRNVSALVAALQQVLDDAVLRQRMGRAARQIALREFDQRHVFERTATIYTMLLRQRGMETVQ